MSNRKSFDIRLADKTVRIVHNYDVAPKMCRDYMIKCADCDFIVNISDEDIEKEFYRDIEANRKEKDSIVYNKAYLETLAVYRKIADNFINEDILLMHGAAIAIHGKAIIFLAKSGIGKTTHICNWIKAVPDVIVINGDKPLVDINKQKVYGTPWAGKENYNTNTSAGLGAFCILERAKDNSIEKITYEEALPKIIEQVYRPDDKAKYIKAIQNLVKLKDIPCYRLQCNQDVSSANVSYSAICSEWI